MNKKTRSLLSAATVGAYSLVLFTAAGFFFASYREVIATCSRFSVADCQANDAIIVSAISLKIGTVVFFLMGTFAWAMACYIVVRTLGNLGVVRLP